MWEIPGGRYFGVPLWCHPTHCPETRTISGMMAVQEHRVALCSFFVVRFLLWRAKCFLDPEPP